MILGGLGRLANIGRLKIDPDVISHVNHHVSGKRTNTKGSNLLLPSLITASGMNIMEITKK